MNNTNIDKLAELKVLGFSSEVDDESGRVLLFKNNYIITSLDSKTTDVNKIINYYETFELFM